jgi:peptidyl-prolyl cis-trans isomerase SurA
MLVGEARAERQVLDRVVAIVDDDVVLESELAKFMAADPEVQMALSQLGPNPTQGQVDQKMLEIRVAALDRLIAHRLVLAEAPRLELTADDRQVESYLDNIVRQNQMASVEEMRQAVEASGQYESWDEYKEILREQILAFQVRSVLGSWSVSEAQVKARYRELAKGEEAEADLVRFDFRPTSDAAESRDAAYATAKKTARRLSAGEPVERLAKELKLDVEPTTVKRGSIAKVFREPVFSARSGAIVGPIQAGQGYTVFKVLEMRASDLRGYEDAKDELRRSLEIEAEQKAFQAVDDELRARAHVDVRL